jgi:amino acid permease
MKLISREEALGGLSGRAAKQASTLLILIENRTAYCVAQARQAMDEFLTETVAAERSQAYLTAIALGREAPVPPTIQQLEHYAAQWADLVPENPAIRAGVAYLLSQKYILASTTTPQLRAALGLDSRTVQEAYQRIYGQPLDKLFSAQLSLAEQGRWQWTRLGRWLEDLPPFWTAFALTLTNTVGSSILALPIALAGIGPLAGVVVLIVLGLVNVLTIAYMAEIFTRTGSIRYGKTFVGRVVTDYLGRTGAIILSIGTLLYCALSLFAYYIGFSSTLAAATHIPAPVWAALLFFVGLYFVRRESLSATVVSALVIGAINMTLILLLSVLAFRQARIANLTYVNLPWLNGRPFEPAILRLVLGVVLGVYSGHLSVSNCAQVVLRRDPSGRALMRGATAALLSAIVLFCIWVVAVNGAIDPARLAKESGTALVPLAAQVGPLIHLFGTIYVFLGIGMVSIHSSLGLFNLTREWVPTGWGANLWRGRGRFLILLLPMTLVFGLTEWLLFTGLGSFAQINSVRGALIAPLLTGIFPVLLLVASRRKGEVLPGVVYQWLGQPWLVVGIYLLFMTSIFLHGLVFWSNPIQRGIAIVVGLLLLGMTIHMVRQGVLRRRLLFEVRQEANHADSAAFAVMASGQPLPLTLHLGYANKGKQETQTIQAEQGELAAFSTLRILEFALADTQVGEMKVWAHRITPEGESEGLPVTLQIDPGNGTQPRVQTLANGQTIMALGGTEREATIRFTDSR